MATCSSSKQIQESSVSISSPCHDVFLSFKSIDTRKIFVEPLCTALNLDGVQTVFYDSQLGEEEEEEQVMSSLMVAAIKESKIIIVVISKHYASSGWCLDQLVQILRSKITGKQQVIPIFYHVDPTDVGHQTGDFGAAFRKYTDTNKKLRIWKAALMYIARLSGFNLPDSQTGGLEFEFELKLKCILEIVKRVKRDISNYERRKRRSLGLEVFQNILKQSTVNTLSTSSQADEMEVQLDFPRRNYTLFDISELLGLMENVLEHKLPKSKFVVIRNLKVMLIRNSKLPEIPDNLSFPDLEMLFFLMSNPDMIHIPSSFFERMPALEVLDMSNTSIKAFPPSVSKLIKLEELLLRRCEHLMELPHEIGALGNLKVLDLSGCTNLAEIPESIDFHETLCSLDLRDYCKCLKKLPESIRKLRSLNFLYLSGCSSLLEFHAREVSINRLSTASQADKMEVKLDFHESDGTLFDITELLGLMEKVLGYKLLKSKFVAVMNLRVIHMTNFKSKLPEIPDNLSFPDLEELFLQSNLNLSHIPSLFFERMPALKVLDMSNTSIKTLPPSVSKLIKLEELHLRCCELLMELPHEIGTLGNLKVLDLEGTDLVCLPEELGELIELKCLKVSLCDADSYRKRKDIVDIIPRMKLSKLTQLEELSINVTPQDIWCNAAVEAIMEDLPSLRTLKTLKLYLPTTVLLQKLLELKWNNDGLSIYQNLSNFNFIIGPHAERFISRLPCNLEEEFLKLKKCLKYISGKDNMTTFSEALKHANALYLDCHWTIQKLPVFKLEELNELKFCLLVDCNEMQTVFDESDFNHEVANKGDNLHSLQYLAIHYLKNLEVIWRGPGVDCCLQSLKVLALHMCPNLNTIFTQVLLRDLVNLEEIIVEDCPKIKTLVDADLSLPALKKLSLLYLPELVSISRGLSIGPKLENIVIYDCPKLKRLPCVGVCSTVALEIKGESEWWNALEWSSGQPYVFSELDIDGDLLEELAPKCGTSLHSLKESNAN